MVDLMTPQKVISLEFSPDANKFVCVLVNEKENKGGYYIYNIVSKQFIRLRELEISDRSYLMSLILGQRRPYSWK